MSNEKPRGGNGPVPGVCRKAVPIARASGPAEYTAGQQELPVRLTSLAEMISAASAPQYDLSRFGSEVFRSSPT
jgi:NADH-quinone oxidoreductase subunit B